MDTDGPATASARAVRLASSPADETGEADDTGETDDTGDMGDMGETGDESADEAGEEAGSESVNQGDWLSAGGSMTAVIVGLVSNAAATRGSDGSGAADSSGGGGAATPWGSNMVLLHPSSAGRRPFSGDSRPNPTNDGGRIGLGEKKSGASGTERGPAPDQRSVTKTTYL